MKCINSDDLASLGRDAAGAPRRRSNLNLHAELTDPVQRLLIALEPGSYVRPHRHTAPAKWELFAILSGRLAVLILDGDGKVLERVEMGASGAVRVVEIPAGAWHSIAAQEPGTVILEVKPGPYAPLAGDDFAPWAPAEGGPGAAKMAAQIAVAAAGERLA